MLFLFFCFIFLFVLRIEQALAFAFTNVGPITILQLARVSWTLDPSDDQSEIRLLVLAANGTAHETIGNFFSMNEYIFNVTDAETTLGLFMEGRRMRLSSSAQNLTFWQQEPCLPFHPAPVLLELRLLHHRQSELVLHPLPGLPIFPAARRLYRLRRRTPKQFSSSASSSVSSSSPPSSPSPYYSSAAGESAPLHAIGFQCWKTAKAELPLVLTSSRHRHRSHAQHHHRRSPRSPRPARLHTSPLPVSASVGKAARRQAHLAQQMQAIRAEMDELSRLPSTSSRPASVSPNEDGRTPGSGEGVTAESHTAEQFAALQARIRELEAQVRSQFALGLSDEAPPGYAVLKAMGRLNFRAEFGPQP